MEDFVSDEAIRLENVLLAELQASGIELNAADRDVFLEASPPIYEEFGVTVKGGAEMIETAIKLANHGQ